MKNKAVTVFGTLVWLLAGLCNVQPAEVIYTLSSVGSGRLGTNSFFSAPFTITSTADTSQITHPLTGIFRVPDITATVFVSGIGTATFTIPTINVVNQHNTAGTPGVGISDPGQGLAILFAFGNPALASYDLSTSLGPITGTPGFNNFASFGTTAGDFLLSSASTVTFQAIVVPEPSIPGLLGFGCICATSQLLRRGKLPG
jgi:hypothetical protein